MARDKTRSTPAQAGWGAAPILAPQRRGAVPILAAALLAAGLAAAACSSRATTPARSEALRGQELGPVVDSIVVPPFERGASVQINPLDLNLFRDQFEAQVLARPGLKAYPSPPTTLANTVILSGKLLGYEVREQTAQGMYLRTIDMVVDVAVRVGGEKEPAFVLSRSYSYQKLYLQTAGVAALEYDLRNAAREVTGSLALILVPRGRETPKLQSAVDTDSGENYSHPWLTRGNREAGFGRYERAISSWSLLIYDPAQPKAHDRFRVSARTLAHLAADGVPDKQLEALRPLTRYKGRSLESVRDEVTRALGPNSGLEPKVLQLSDEVQDRIQVNLSRAHFNLSQVYLLSRRYDVAAYHLAHAYGFDPRAVYLDAWTRLQLERQLIPASARDNPEARTWIMAYLLVPAPFTARVVGGVYETNVMPAPAFTPVGAPEQPAPAPLPAPVTLPPVGAPPPAPAPPSRQAPAAAPGTHPRGLGPPASPRPSQPAQRLGY